jgi:RNA polymerase sigma factor (sigma-70 family)
MTSSAGDRDLLVARFEENRTRLRSLAYRMLGSLTEADDAVQEAWLRLHRSDTEAIDNLAGWLTTVTARVCLDILRTRESRREDALEDDRIRVPDPIVSNAAGMDPEHEALLADTLGLALLVVLETMAPAERLAFVLHDMFAVPFDEIAPIVDRSPTAARQLASRARRRLQGTPTVPDADLVSQRRVVDAFLAAARDGDFEGLLAVLDPDAVLRADAGALPLSREVRGARAVAAGAMQFAPLARAGRAALVNGAAGLVAAPEGRPFSVLGFTIAGGRIVEIDVLADPERLRAIDLTVLDD